MKKGRAKNTDKTTSRRKNLNYIVSVGTLTTGFDAPHVDVVAVLRPLKARHCSNKSLGAV